MRGNALRIGGRAREPIRERSAVFYLECCFGRVGLVGMRLLFGMRFKGLSYGGGNTI